MKMKVICMLIPKSNIKYRSVKRIKVNHKDKYLRFLQSHCYLGHFPMNCNNCSISSSCWFCGLKPFRG